MNTNSQSQDDLIFQYLDGQITMKEKTEFEDSLKTNSVLQERFYELKTLHDTLKQGRLEAPSLDFTSKVMSGLHASNTKISFSPKNGLMLLLGIGIAVMLAVVFLYTGTFDQITGVLTLDQLNLPKTIPVNSIPFNASLVMKGLIGLNLAIAFILIDKTILQPFFRNRAAR